MAALLVTITISDDEKTLTREEYDDGSVIETSGLATDAGVGGIIDGGVITDDTGTLPDVDASPSDPAIARVLSTAALLTVTGTRGTVSERLSYAVSRLKGWPNG